MKVLLGSVMVSALLVAGGCATGGAARSETQLDLNRYQNPLGLTDPVYQKWWDIGSYNPYAQ